VAKENLSQSEQTKNWFGMTQIILEDKKNKLGVTIGPVGVWDQDHIDKLKIASELAGINPVIDCDFTADGKPYAAVPLLGYPNLNKFLEKKDLNWDQKLHLVETCARILEGAHKKGLTHGAFCPEQIFINNKEVFIDGIGFGTGGTPPDSVSKFLAPENTSNITASESADIFSLGKLLEVLSEDEEAPRSLKRLITWSTSENPEARPPSALEFASIVKESLSKKDPYFQAGYIAISEYEELIKTSAESLDKNDEITEQDSIKQNDISFADLKAKQEARRVSSTLVQETDEDLEVVHSNQAENISSKFSDNEPKRGFLLKALGVAAVLLAITFFISSQLNDEDDNNLALDQKTSETEASSSPSTEKEATAKDTKQSDDVSGDSEEFKNTLINSSVVDIADAGLQIVHGIPETEVDVYFDDELIIKGFSSGDVVGPIVNEPGEYKIGFYKAEENPPVAQSDRKDSAVLDSNLKMVDEPVSVIAFVDSFGNISLNSTSTIVSDVAPGKSRVMVHNYTTENSIEVLLNDESFNITNGASSVSEVAAGNTILEIRAENQTLSDEISLLDGELSNIFIYGSGKNKSINLSEIRLSGLDSAPIGIPSGDSGLLEKSKNQDIPAIKIGGLLFILVATGLVLRRNTRVKNEFS